MSHSMMVDVNVLPTEKSNIIRSNKKGENNFDDEEEEDIFSPSSKLKIRPNY